MHTRTARPSRSAVRPMAALTVVLGFAAALLAAVATGGAPVSGAPLLTVSTLTWDVIGLDSNKVTDGPDLFPVGVRVCNTGTSAADDVATRFVWDSANTYLSVNGASTISLGSLGAGACADAYFNIEVQRTKSAYDTFRRYHVEVTDSGVLATSTPTPRQLYVEKLVSQNRNSIERISGPGGFDDPPATTVYVGQTYTYQLHGSTATNGYEQLEAFLDFPNIIFRVRSVRATYTEPAGGTNDRPYADACGWDEVPTSTSYRSCIGPQSFGGKAGGGIVVTYEVQVLSAGSATVSGLIYDFSGSSFHYNDDHSVDTISIVALDAPPPTTTTTTVPPTTTTTTTTVPPTTTTTTTTVPPTTTTTTVPPTTTTTTTVPPTTTTTTTTVLPTTTTTTTVPPTTTTTTSPIVPVPTIDRVQLAPVCVADIPYVDYAIEVSNTPATTATLSFFDLDGALVERRTGLPLTGRVLYPGASAEPADWPGWALVEGVWVVDPSDARWRDGLDVVVEVNPTASGSVTYPPATSACASPGGADASALLAAPATTAGTPTSTSGTAVTDRESSDQLVRQTDGSSPTTTQTAVRLPATGATGRPDRTLEVATVTVLLGAALTLLARRSRRDQPS